MLPRLTAGQAVDAAQWNALIAQLEAALPAAGGWSAELFPPPAAVPEVALPRPKTHEFLNTSAHAVPACGAMRVTGATLLGGRAVLTTTRPDANFARLAAVNGPSDVPSGQVGRCQLGGVVEVLFGSGLPEAGEGWGPAPGQFSLERYQPGGFSVLGVSNGAGQRMLCHLAAVDAVLGKLTVPLAAGGAATVELASGVAGAEAALSVELLAADWLLGPGAGPLPTGTPVACQWINGQWYITGL